MVKSVILSMVKNFEGQQVRPAWVKDFSELIKVREIQKTEDSTMFLAYLESGAMVNFEVLKDKEGKYIFDNLGGELESTYKDEG